MNKIAMKLSLGLILLWAIGTTQATVLYYTYEGSLGQISGNAELLEQQNFSIGDNFMYVIMVDYDRTGEVTRNNGETFLHAPYPISFYADLITSTEFEAIDGGSHNGDFDYLEYNYGYVEEHPDNMYRSNIYVGSGDAYIHLSHYSLSDKPFNEWEVGQYYDIGVTFTVFDSSGDSAAGYTYGLLTSISETNPVPEPTSILLLLATLPFARRKMTGQKLPD